MSYAKFFENTFRALTFGSLVYPNGTIEMVWLLDAAVKYLSEKHIPLFIVAIIILLTRFAYTVLLFSWQWLLWLSRWKIFMWARNKKLHTFVETYNVS